jgi:hypothetical protein
VGKGSREVMVGAEAVSSVLAVNLMTPTLSRSGDAPKLIWLCSVNRFDCSSRIALISERLLIERNGMLAPC